MNTLRIENILSTLRRLTDEMSGTATFKGLREQFRHLRMPSFSWPALRIGEKVARIPVIQGGMGVGISLSGLSSAVARSGGIGVIAANAIGMLEKDYYRDGRSANLRALRREIQTAREKSNGLIGVNIMVAVNDFHELMDVAVEEKVDLIIMGAGLPIKGIPVEEMRRNGVKAVPIVSSARAAEVIFRMWKRTYNDIPDAVICEGPLAGGHLGFSEEQIDHPDHQLETIVPQIVETLKPYEDEFKRTIPVIAAGGIFTGDDIHSALKYGATAVQMGTRFVATDECDADLKFKEAFVDCTSDQIGLIKSPVGMPGRAIRDTFIQASEEGDLPSFRCAWKCLASCKADEAQYCISVALNNARKGKLEKGFVFVGANAHRVSEIVAVDSLIGELAEGYRQSSRESATHRLEAMVARVQELWHEYESAVTARIREVRNGGKLHKPLIAGRLRELQAQIVQGIADSWAVLHPRANTNRG